RGGLPPAVDAARTSGRGRKIRASRSAAAAASPPTLSSNTSRHTRTVTPAPLYCRPESSRAAAGPGRRPTMGGWGVPMPAHAEESSLLVATLSSALGHGASYAYAFENPTDRWRRRVGSQRWPSGGCYRDFASQLRKTATYIETRSAYIPCKL